METAKESIYVRAFLWRDDATGNRLAQAILDAAKRGVKVEIEKDRIAAVYEYTGGSKQSFFHKRVNWAQGVQAWFLSTVYRTKGSFRQNVNTLAEAILGHPNIRVRHQRKRFDHSKLFVFDEERCIIGSMGIGDNHFEEWVDVVVEINGKEHIDRLRERMNGGAKFDSLRSLDFLLHIRDLHPPKTCPMVDERLALIDAAKESVLVEMAYLGDRRFTLALLRAIRRGIDVTVVTSFADVLGNLNLSTCDFLLRQTKAPENLRIVVLPRVVHSKVVVVDDRFCDVGSANFTPLSHGVYDEINVYVDNRRFALAVTKLIEKHIVEGEIAESRVSGYKKFASQMERAIMAYQSRKGG